MQSQFLVRSFFRLFDSKERKEGNETERFIMTVDASALPD